MALKLEKESSFPKARGVKVAGLSNGVTNVTTAGGLNVAQENKPSQRDLVLL